jgi:hypothetical protein
MRKGISSKLLHQRLVFSIPLLLSVLLWYQSHPLSVGQISPLLWSTCLVGLPRMMGHIKVRVLSHIDQVFLGCAINKS